MYDFNLPIFPFDSTAITLTTTVWVGVCVAVFFNLRLGWTLSGLVVPGYLVPLIMTRPITAGVILLEAVVTYCVVLILSELPRRLPYWSSFFGRDRFFAILVVSVLVRAVLDGWVLPYAGRLAIEEYGINFDYRNNLHSFGLIVVALIANYFWKPGVARGIIPLVTCVGLTYVVIRFLVVGLTNFNVGNFHLLYEDVSTSLLASPKAYILVLTTAFLASWFNLRYAWDFNGILIPALLGLLWHEPLKIVASAGECVIILGIATCILKTPWFRTVTMEGGRKLFFFFTICFVYRLLLCHLLPLGFPGIELSETFGFGYLLSTLMAIKAHDKHLVVRLIRSITEVSMLGAVAGSLIGFAFYCGPEIRFDWSLSQAVATNSATRESLLCTDRPLIELVRADKILLYEKQKPESYQPPVPAELNTFHNSVKQLRELDHADPDSPRLQQIAERLKAINYQLLVVQDRFIYLREQSPTHGWGMYVIDTKQTDGICIEVPTPMKQWATIESGLCLFQQFPSVGLAIAGAPRNVNITGSADVTKSKETMFAEFHKVFGQSGLIQVRGYTRRNFRQLADKSTRDEGGDFQTAKSQLWIRGHIPAQLNLNRLKNLAGAFDILWNNSPVENQLRRNTRGDFAELILNEPDRRRLIGQLYGQQPANDTTDQQAKIRPKYAVEVIEQNLRDWMNGLKTRICQQGSNGYQPARIEQMIYMDHEVVTPLVELLNELPSNDNFIKGNPFWLDEEVKSHLLPIQGAAAGLGYRLVIVVDPQTSETYVALAESEMPTANQPPKGWGSFIFRPGLADSFAVEIPRPLFEQRSFEFGVNLFERPRSSALLIAGAHPRANLDGSSDISKAANKTNLFNLVRHVMLRQMGDRPFLISQARAIQAPVEADIVLATDDGTRLPSELSPMKKRLYNQLSDDRLDIAFVDGRHATAGYELGILMQATAVQVSQNKEVVSLWLSPSLRTKFRDQSENLALAAQFEACGLPTIERGLIDYLAEHELLHCKQKTNDAPRGLTGAMLPAGLKRELKEYVDSFDILKLLEVTTRFDDWSFVRLVDGISGQAYLLISKQPDELPTVLNLTGYVADHAFEFETADPQTINAFIRARALWLEPVSSNRSPTPTQLQPVSTIKNTGSPRNQSQHRPQDSSAQNSNPPPPVRHDVSQLLLNGPLQ